MPSATIDAKVISDASDLPQSVMQILEKKVRNLEKRKGRLDAIKQKQQEGVQLVADQLEALSKYGEVLSSLELIQELIKQVQTLINETARQQKKTAKREQNERQASELNRTAQVLRFWSLLHRLAEKEDAIRPFLQPDEWHQAKSFWDLVVETQQRSGGNDDELIAQYLVSLVEAKQRPAVGNTTYATLNQILLKVEGMQIEDTIPLNENSNHQDTQDYSESTSTSAAPTTTASTTSHRGSTASTETGAQVTGDKPFSEVLTNAAPEGSFVFLQESQIDEPTSGAANGPDSKEDRHNDQDGMSSFPPIGHFSEDMSNGNADSWQSGRRGFRGGYRGRGRGEGFRRGRGINPRGGRSRDRGGRRGGRGPMSAGGPRSSVPSNNFS